MPTKPKAERKEEQLAFLVETNIKRRLEDLARARKIPVSQIGREAISQYLAKVA